MSYDKSAAGKLTILFIWLMYLTYLAQATIVRLIALTGLHSALAPCACWLSSHASQRCLHYDVLQQNQRHLAGCQGMCVQGIMIVHTWTVQKLSIC